VAQAALLFFVFWHTAETVKQPRVLVQVDAAGTAYWNNTWDALGAFEKYAGPIHEQHPVLKRYLQGATGDAIEIGCVPGNFLVYLNKEYGYTASGIDYSEYLDYTRENLRFNGIEAKDLFQADLFNFSSPRLYDLVFSSGFVEHFEDHDLVIRKHAELAKPGGLVVIMVPNLRHLHYVLCRAFQPKVLAVHRFTLMKQARLRRSLERCGLDVMFCGYQKTFRPTYKLPKAADFSSRAVQKLLRVTHLDNVGNPIASPYLISVSRKPA
jgi:SAM-dependent methyltransferase